MKSRASQSSNPLQHKKKHFIVAASLVIIAVAAATFFFYRNFGWLTLQSVESGETYARYLVHDGDGFSVGFIHSVNKSPLTDYYVLHDHRIYVEKTIYYGFGAGVQTELEEGQELSYGEDGSMIVTGFHKEIPDLLYIVGTISDHTMAINDGEPISLSALCGARSKVRFSYDPLF